MNGNSEKYHLWITDNYENSDINKFEVKKDSQKLHALPIIAHYMDFGNTQSLM